jgi:hypothetical protein
MMRHTIPDLTSCGLMTLMIGIGNNLASEPLFSPEDLSVLTLKAIKKPHE